MLEIGGEAWGLHEPTQDQLDQLDQVGMAVPAHQTRPPDHLS